VQDEIAKVVNVRVNALLAKIPLKETLGKGPAQLDLWLNVTELTAQSSSYAAVGMLMLPQDPQPDSGECPLSPVAMPDMSGGNYLQFFFSDAVVGCMSYYEFITGEIDFIVNPTISKDFPLMNTSDWSLLIPQLYKAYPDMALQFEFIAVLQPTFQCVAGIGASASARFDMNMSVIMPNGTLIPAVTLELDAMGAIEITAGMKGFNATLFANMTSLDLNVSVVSSNIGPLNPVLLETIAKELGPALQKAVNTLGAIGFPLPTLDGVSLLSPTVDYNDGYIAISSDFDYSPHLAHLDGKWECGDIAGKFVCALVHNDALQGKNVFWAQVQDVSSGAVAQGFETDSAHSAVAVAASRLPK